MIINNIVTSSLEDSIKETLKSIANIVGLCKIYNTDDYYDFIDSMITYYNKLYVRIRDVDIIKRRENSNFRNNLKRLSNRISYPCNISIPGDKYNKFPIFDKIIRPDTIVNWDSKYYKKGVEYDKVLSDVTKQVTNKECSNVLKIGTIKLSNTVTINNEKEYLDIIEKYRYPERDINFIKQYIESIIYSFKNIKTLNITDLNNDSTKAIGLAIKQINSMNNLFKATINVLISLYFNKLKVVTINTISPIDSQIVSESCFNGLIEETIMFLTEGYSEQNIQALVNNKMERDKSNIETIKEYLSIIYEQGIDCINYHKEGKYKYINSYKVTEKTIQKILEPMVNPNKDDEYYDKYIKQTNNSEWSSGIYIIPTQPEDRDLILIHSKEIEETLTKHYNSIIQDLDNLYSEYKAFDEKKYYDCNSNIFDRSYKSMDIVHIEEIENIRHSLLSKDDMEMIKKEYEPAYSFIESGVCLNTEDYFKIIHYLNNSKYSELIPLYERYYDLTRLKTITYFDFRYKHDDKPIGTNVYYEIPKWIIAEVVQFQNKIQLIE